MHQNCVQILISILIITFETEKLAIFADNSNEKSAVSDSFMNENICNHYEKRVAYDVIMFDNSRLNNDEESRIVKRETMLNENDFQDRPRIDQKSLLIVFDATGSMHDDLEQLRSGAKEIIHELSARTDNPIFNYILVVFRDPDVEAPFDTRNSDDLLSMLQTIKIHGGGDCPEMAISGLKIALELALPNSLAYVFSDATAKDFRHYNEALDLLQKKQITVNFLLTGDCNNPKSNEYQVYHHLSRASNGQVYDMSKSNVKDVLLAIRHTVNHNYAALKSVDSETAGLTQTKLNVDKSISELSVSVSGKNPSLTIKDPRNETVKSVDELALKNLKLVKIKDPLGGEWNVEASADSSHSIRLGAISEIKFRFGFSVNEPKKITETSFQPLRGAKNIISIFVDDQHLIHNLTDVTISLLSSNKEEDLGVKFKIPIRAVNEKLFITKAFDVPRQMFNIHLNGFDANGNTIERLISTGIQSKEGSSPEVKIEVNRREINENEKLLIRCFVKSLTLVNISIELNEKILKYLTSSQSNEIEFQILNVEHNHSGNYSCKAINEFGEKSDEIFVNVKSPPRINVSTKELIAIEGSEVEVECQLENSNESSVKWINEFKEILSTESLYKFNVSRELNNSTILCQYDIPGFKSINESVNIFIEYSPKFNLNHTEARIEIAYGSKVELNCESDANPPAKIIWKFENEKQNFNGNIFIIENVREKHVGKYECHVHNSYGNDKKQFEIDIFPQTSPKFEQTRDYFIANESDSVEFVCEVYNSLPLKVFEWKIENYENYEIITTFDEDKNIAKKILKIKNAKTSESFECLVENEFGKETKNFDLIVQFPAKIESVLLHYENGTEIELENNERIIKFKNSSFQIECSFNGFPFPEIKWIKNGIETQLAENDQTLLNFNEIADVHEGNYTCKVENLLGISMRNFSIHVHSRPKLMKNSQPTSLNVIEETQVELLCEFEGKPIPNVSWFSNNNQIYESSNLLSFKAKVENSGIYSCLGSNKYGEDSFEFSLYVMGIPKFLTPDDASMKVLIGEDISLLCDANGFPQPEISWYLNNQIISNESSLILDKVETSNVYICNAQNEAGVAQKIFYINVVSFPSILSKFVNIDIFTNQSKSQECFAEGIPNPNIYWTFNNLKISNDKILTLNSTMDSGRYFCIAENSEGKSEAFVDVQVMNKPKKLQIFDEIKSNFKLREGDQIDLICPYENFNFIFWYHNDDNVEQLDIQENEKRDNRLKLKDVDERTNGIWKCEVINSAGNESFTFNISVTTSPSVYPSWNLNNRISDFLFTESDIDERFFKIGETLTLNCSARGSPKPKIVWKKATDVIAEGELLVIANLEFHHSDIYTCSAQNENGIVKKFFKIDVISAPFIENDLDIEKQFHKRVGESIIFRCRITANPQPTIFWFKDNTLLDETNKFLEIEKIKSEDDGVYKCIGKNSWGRESIEFHLKIMDGAKIEKTEIIEENSRNEKSIRISCSAKGYPMPIISWISNGHILSTTSKLNFEKLLSTVDENSIYFTGHGQGITYLDPKKLKKINFYSELTMIDSKTIKLDIVFHEKSEKVAGNYKCYAYNALGRSEKSVDVEVLQQPFIIENEQIYKDIEILENLPLLINCPISGHPKPSITWFKNHRQIYENETVKFINSNRFLSISEAFIWNTGNYSCKGVNKLGEKMMEFSVKVLAPPKFMEVSILSPKQKFYNDKVISQQKFHDRNIMKVMQGDDVTMECFAEGFPKPQIHWLKIDFHDRNKKEILDDNENILILENIKTSSIFMCYLNNTMGNIQKVFEIDVQMTPKFIESQTEEKISVKLHHGQNLECKVTGNPEPDVKWIFNNIEITSENKQFYLTSDNQIMRIIESKKSNQGKYLCIAENDYGKIEKVFYVNIEVPIEWSTFGPWSECSKSCGSGGIQYRTRVCLLSNGLPALGDDQKCIGENVETRKCNQLACPINGGWNEWSEWSKCPDCIDNKIHKLPVTSKRTRECNNPSPSNGGLECFGDSFEEVECMRMKFCPIHGGWSEWSAWSSCSKTCGNGLRNRKRFCTNPTPNFNGTECDGENVEYEECRLTFCYGNSLKKAFETDNDEDYFEDYSNDSQNKFKELAELEIVDENGVTRNYQLTQHREVEFHAPKINEKLPKVKITLETYKPISAETYNNFVNDFNDDKQEDNVSLDNILDFESPEDDENQHKNCMRGFSYNIVNRQCEDIDECKLNSNICKTTENCINLPGSFKCEKRRRRKLSSNY